jgi:hypothetical protein
MGPFIAAWLVGEGIIVYRSVKNQKVPPGPGQLLLSSGVFIMLALLAEAPSARRLAVTLAWGFDIAALMNLWGTGGPKASTGPSNWPPEPAAPSVIIPNSGTPAEGSVTN